MKKYNFAPASVIGTSCAAAFYTMSFFKSSFLFCLFGSLALCGLFFFRIKPFGKLVFFCSCGIGAAILSYISAVADNRPIVTLCPLSKIKQISVCIKGEPIPAGCKYRKIKAEIISCSDKKGAIFSASGKINLFMPSVIILGNNAGGVCMFKENNQACTIFTEGVILSCTGNFSEKQSIFEKQFFFVKSDAAPTFIAWSSDIKKYRGFLRFELMRLLYSFGKAGTLLIALLSANKDFIPAETLNAFHNAGLSHVLALSGMHLSIIASAAAHIGGIAGTKRLSIAASVAAAVFFVWFAGSAPSLNRAIGMMLLLLLGKRLGLTPNLFPILAAVFTVHILSAPREALTLGFMLSYGALAGILLFGKAFDNLLRGKMPPLLASGLSASAGAYCFTSPVIIASIGKIAPAGVLASIIISPLIALFIILGIFSLIISICLPCLQAVIAGILNIFYNLIAISVNFFALFFVIKPQNIFTKIAFSFLFIIFGFTAMLHCKKEKNKIAELGKRHLGSTAHYIL